MRSHASRPVAILTAIALTLAASACGGDDADTTPTAPDPTTATTAPGTSPTDTTAPETSAPATTTRATTPETTAPGTSAPETTAPGIDPVPVVVYFALNEQMVPVRRHLDDLSAGLLEGTFEAWLAGPSADEAAAGHVSLVPDGTRLLGATYASEIVTVDLSAEFASGGGSAGIRGRLAQLVMTATSAVILLDGVELRIDGEPVEVFSGEGIVIDGLLTIDDAEEFLPAIVQHAVLPGDVVSEGVQVSGWANVFEAVVSLQVVDGAGAVIHDSTTMATCGTGCRGTFVTFLTFGGYVGPATLRLFEVSARDGSETNLVEIPITVE